MQTELRRRYRESRRQFIAKDGQSAAQRLTAHLRRFLNECQSDAKTPVCLYRPLPEEAEFHLEPLSDYYFPRLNGENLEFRRPHSDDAFEANTFGIQEPIVSRSESLAEDAAVVCCPAVAVDWRGQRLGMGKGYYDRFFKNHPRALRVAVVYQIQIAKDPLPAESWDQPVDWIVSEEMILRTANRSL